MGCQDNARNVKEQSERIVSGTEMVLCPVTNALRGGGGNHHIISALTNGPRVYVSM